LAKYFKHDSSKELNMLKPITSPVVAKPCPGGANYGRAIEKLPLFEECLYKGKCEHQREYVGMGMKKTLCNWVLSFNVESNYIKIMSKTRDLK